MSDYVQTPKRVKTQGDENNERADTDHDCLKTLGKVKKQVKSVISKTGVRRVTKEGLQASAQCHR